jgi:hypothetical protein
MNLTEGTEEPPMGRIWGKSELQVRCKVDDRTRLQEPEIAESL